MPTTVTIGGADATDVTVTSETELTAVVPSGTAGAADVVVTTSAGSDTLTGTRFRDGDTTVTVGGTAATDVTFVSATEVTFVTPAGTGTADVVVSTSGGSATLADAFTYDPALAVTAIDPESGPAAGGNTVTITGTGFELT